MAHDNLIANQFCSIRILGLAMGATVDNIAGHTWPIHCGANSMIDDKSFPPRQYLGVMVSSTFQDLEQHRVKLMNAISGQAA